jgi:hypothetical protein
VQPFETFLALVLCLMVFSGFTCYAAHCASPAPARVKLIR